MTGFEDEIDDPNDENGRKAVSKRKVLLFLLPLLIVIGVSVGLYHTFGNSLKDVPGLSYSVVEKQELVDGKNENKTLVFYDLPEISSRIRTGDGRKEIVKIKISIELSRVEDIKTIEGLLPKLSDIIINHTSELTSDEINGANGLYWLKEELLYRINLVTAPIKIENLNFKAFEVQQKN